MQVQSRLKQIRQDLGLTVLQMAEKINEKDYRIRDMENGKQKITHDFLEKLTGILDINLNWLIMGAGERYNKKTIEHKHIDVNEHDNTKEICELLKRYASQSFLEATKEKLLRFKALH
jgi:transcriptional regulator with XRE-family HTH domain